MFKKFFDQPKTPYFLIWLSFFIYTGVIAFFIQLIFLPYIAPSWNAGHGLIKGGDWVWFHQIAIDLLDNMRTNGWGIWTLRPLGQAPAGVAAAIYYFTVPEPWTIIPLNAALHSSAAVVLMLIIQQFVKKWSVALLSSLPFVLYPSAMTWYTQLHKDGFYILGSLLIIYGWVLISKLVFNYELHRKFWKPYLIILLGAGSTWVVRPYTVQMALGLSIFAALILTIWGFIDWAKRLNYFSWKFWGMPVFFLIVIMSLIPFTWQGIGIKAAPEVAVKPDSSLNSDSKPPKPDLSSSSINIESFSTGENEYNLLVFLVNGSSPGIDYLDKIINIPNPRWEPILPTQLDNIFYTLATIRDGFILSYPEASSNIDSNIHFRNLWDFIFYVPRATEIALLSPFPNTWFDQGNSMNGGIIRKISGIEMLGSYFFLLFVLLSFKKWHSRPEWWVVLLYCIGMMVTYAIINPNTGTLYRVRFAFMLTLMAVGIAYFLQEFSLIEPKNNSPVDKHED